MSKMDHQTIVHTGTRYTRVAQDFHTADKLSLA